MAQARKSGDRDKTRELRRSLRRLPSVTRKTPDTGGYGTPVTPTIISWGSPDRRPKPRRSKISWRGSCAKTSRSNSTRTRH